MRKFKKAALAVCIAETIIVMGGMTACGAKNDSNVNVPQQETVVTSEAQPQQETVPQDEPQQETVQPQPGEMQQETVPSGETQTNESQQTTVQSNTAQKNTDQMQAVQPNAAQATTAQPNTSRQNTNQPVQNGAEQISLETAKSVALTDAGVSASDIIYTKEKLDYEDGVAVYDIEFYADNVEYDYEINAATGAVYSKSVDMHHNQTEHGHNGHAGTSDSYIGNDSAKSIALNHAGFSETEVSRLKSEFDFDDGLAVYEVEFDKDGREYEYTISAIDGSVIEYDVD